MTQHLSVDGVRSLVRTAGPATGSEAVVFLHGNPGSSEDWSHLLGQIGQVARAVAPDMPGFGKAERPTRWPYDVPAYARHLDGLLRALGITRVHLVLHDFGGPWGLWWASEHPEAVASLTLVNVGIMRAYRWHKFARIWQTPVLGELSQLVVTRRLHHAGLNRENPRPFPREFLDRMYDDADLGMKRAVLKLYRNTRDVAALSEAAAERLAPHRLPTLVVWGKDDPYVPARYAHEQGDVFAVEAVHVLDACGHWPFVDDPARVDAIVLPFLRRQLGVA